VKITSVKAEGFLSYGDATISLPKLRTVITGPNGSGKSNLGRCLDLVVTALRWCVDGDSSGLDEYAAAGWRGSDTFIVKVGAELDQPFERDLVRSYAQAAIASAFTLSGDGAYVVDSYLQEHLLPTSLDALGVGVLVVRRMGMLTSPWQVGWEFAAGKKKGHLRLGGALADQLMDGHLFWSIADPPGGRSIPALLGLTPPYQLDALPESVALPDILPQEHDGYEFVVRAQRSASPASFQRLDALLGTNATAQGLRFSEVLSAVTQQFLTITDNTRLPQSLQYTASELSAPVPLQDGSGAAGELWRLYNGDQVERDRYTRAARLFYELTGRELAIRTRFSSEGTDQIRIEPVVVDDGSELPAVFAGAGVQESLVLATVLSADSGHVLVLDEPAVNLAPTAQRSLWRILSSTLNQVIVITHSPDLVPTQLPPDLSLMRFSRGSDGTRVHAPDEYVLEQPRLPQLLRRADVRALLFASGVVLCEGETEAGVLGIWWEGALSARDGLLAPDAANVALVDVGGHKSFRGFTDLLDAYGVPWVIVCDGPALRPSGALDKQYPGRVPVRAAEDSATESFEEVSEGWRTAGIFTFADRFGDDGSKSGEFEAYLHQIDANRLQQALDLFPKSKVRQAEWFARQTPCPDAAAQAWSWALTRSGL